MRWRCVLWMATLLGIGCQSSQPSINPFLGPTRVPPPATGEAAQPSVGIPYYQGAPPPGSPPPAFSPTQPLQPSNPAAFGAPSYSAPAGTPTFGNPQNPSGFGAQPGTPSFSPPPSFSPGLRNSQPPQPSFGTPGMPSTPSFRGAGLDPAGGGTDGFVARPDDRSRVAEPSPNIPGDNSPLVVARAPLAANPAIAVQQAPAPLPRNVLLDRPQPVVLASAAERPGAYGGATYGTPRPVIVPTQQQQYATPQPRILRAAPSSVAPVVIDDCPCTCEPESFVSHGNVREITELPQSGSLQRRY